MSSKNETPPEEQLMLRKELIHLLEAWRKGSINVRNIHEEAEFMLEQIDYPQYPRSDARSIATEVLRELDNLPGQWICEEDIPSMITFLETRLGEEETGWHHWEAYWSFIDYKSRKEKLKNRDYYLTGHTP